MAQVRIVRGSDKEIAAVLTELKGCRDLTLIVPGNEAAPLPPSSPNVQEHFYVTATQHEFQAAFDALGKGKKQSFVLAPEAFDRENLYDEDRF